MEENFPLSVDWTAWRNHVTLNGSIPENPLKLVLKSHDKYSVSDLILNILL